MSPSSCSAAFRCIHCTPLRRRGAPEYAAIPPSLPEVGVFHKLGSELESLVTRFDGVPTITCLDPRSPASHYNRFAYGAAIAATNTLIIVCMSAWGYRLYAVIRRSYMHDELLHWFVGQQAEQKRRAERLSRAVQLQRGVTCDSTG